MHTRNEIQASKSERERGRELSSKELIMTHFQWDEWP